MLPNKSYMAISIYLLPVSIIKAKTKSVYINALVIKSNNSAWIYASKDIKHNKNTNRLPTTILRLFTSAL